MQCDHYRKTIAADPGQPGEDAVSHARECAACAAFRDELLILDRDIARALAIEVPELRLPEFPPVDAGDESRVVPLAGRRSNGPTQAPLRKRSSLMIGIAAGIAVLALVTLLRPGPELTRPTLAGEVIAHMDHEPESRRVTTVAVPEQRLDAVVEPRVSRLGEGIDLVSYAASCVIGGNTVPHLVVQGDSGPITLILLPDEKVDEPIPLSGEHVHGLILPVGGGSIAVIGEREDQLGEVEQTGTRLADSMKWRI